MAQRRVIDSYERDLGFTVEQLNKLVGAYRVLIGSASDLNGIALASKSDIKEALKRAKEVGCIIEELIEVVDYSICTWSKYMKLKTDYINCRLDLCLIEIEIEEEIRLQGQQC
ncbi:MAG: hypothetical protein RR891_00170 [Clostridium sp.]|uniref:hypothetical protein n=1 Tax=Clostridium sp. TaxID=1506 RepID=UPI00303B5172